MLVSSVTTSPAPISLHKRRNATSLTPAIGARKTRLENFGSELTVATKLSCYIKWRRIICQDQIIIDSNGLFNIHSLIRILLRLQSAVWAFLEQRPCLRQWPRQPRLPCRLSIAEFHFFLLLVRILQ